MSFMDWLRKLGIFRSGAKAATYTNATNRPDEFTQEGVFDAKKDLVNKEDVQKVTTAVNNLVDKK